MDGKIASKSSKDYRLIVVTILRKIFGYSIFLMLIYCFFAYREDINMVNFYRIMSYFDTDTSKIQGFEGYRFEVGIDNTFEPFSGGLVVLNKDSLKLVNPAGLEDLSVQLKYKNPKLLTHGKRIIAYGKDENKLSVFGSYALLKEIKTEFPILSCNMNKNGDFLVIFDEPGYKGSIDRKSVV